MGDNITTSIKAWGKITCIYADIRNYSLTLYIMNKMMCCSNDSYTCTCTLEMFFQNPYKLLVENRMEI